MQIKARYSHLNGEEYLLVHCKELWHEVLQVVSEVDACKQKTSKEKTMPGKKLFAPKLMNKKFKEGFEALGWSERKSNFWVTSDNKLLRSIYHLPEKEQKKRIEEAGQEPIRSFNQTDFVKDRIAVEVQFGKYSFVAYDLFVKHMSFYFSDLIDVGIEILPMKELQKEMSTGVSYYERELLNVLRQGRGVPAVPLVLLGVVP